MVKKKALIKNTDSKTQIKKPTHLHLYEKYLPQISKISLSDSLTVLYLHDNCITKIENLDSAINLRSLYLQNNKICRIENLQSLKKLRKLYLGHNEISVVEGLENLECLEELHLEKQRLGTDSLCFDPRSIIGVAECLFVLNISHNNITTIFGLSSLRKLRVLNASHNKLRHIEDICDTVRNWYYLYEAAFVGNPVAKQHLYREKVIGSTIRLNVLDNKEVHENTRKFIKRLEQEKLNQNSRENINLAQQIQNLPKIYSSAVEKAVSQSILKNSKFSDSTLACDVNDIYLPWKALPKSSGGPRIKVPPPILRKRGTVAKPSYEVNFLEGYLPY